MSDLSVRDARSQIAALRYEGVDSIRDAATLRERMAATVDLARRARVDAREHLWNAREAERALGRMILTARGAGHLVEHGGDRRSSSINPNLNALGVSSDLAALAVRLARVPDETWQAWHELDVEPTQRAIDSAAKEYERRVDAEEHRRREAESAVAEAEADIEQRTAELEQLAAQARAFTERWARDGKLPFVALPSGTRRFRREEIEAILRGEQPAPTSAGSAA